MLCDRAPAHLDSVHFPTFHFRLQSHSVQNAIPPRLCPGCTFCSECPPSPALPFCSSRVNICCSQLPQIQPPPFRLFRAPLKSQTSYISVKYFKRQSGVEREDQAGEGSVAESPETHCTPALGGPGRPGGPAWAALLQSSSGTAPGLSQRHALAHAVPSTRSVTLLFSAWEAPARPSRPSSIKLQRQSQGLILCIPRTPCLMVVCGSLSLGEEPFGGKGHG